MYYSKMALAVIMWVYFITVSQYIHCEVITINNNGQNTTSCCIEGKCVCKSLSHALRNIKSNTTVNVTSKSVSLENNVEIGKGNSISNIFLIGNDVVVMCNNTGGMSWRSGDNVLIEGITWDQCGNPRYPSIPAIEFDNVYNISIIRCAFQHFKVCKTVTLSAKSGNMSVNIANSSFVFNKVENSSACLGNYGIVIIQDSQDTPVRYAKITITMSSFNLNGGPSQPEFNLGVLYCFLKSPLNLSIVIEHSAISSNDILGTLLYNNANSSHMVINNVTVYNNSQGGIKVVSSRSYLTLDMLSSHFIQNNNGALVLNMSNDNFIDLNKIIFTNNKGAYDSHGVALYITAHGNSLVHLSHCNFDCNSAFYGDSIAYVAAQEQTCGLGCNMTVIMSSSRFVNNQLGSALHLSHVILKFYNSTLFQNNSAEAGTGIYSEKNSLLTVTDGALVRFVNNIASLRGGAIYTDLTNCINNGILFSYLSNFSSVVFINNAARISGNAIYFNIPKSCKVQRDYTKNDSVAYIPYRLDYTQSHNNIIGPPIAATPYKINLCSYKCSFPDKSCSIKDKKMLGQLISFGATVCDYFNAVAETVQFRIGCTDCDTKYRLPNSELLINSKLPNKIFILATDAQNDIINDSNISLELSSVLSDDYNEFYAELSLTLSTCYNGFLFSNVSQKCVCYNSSDNDVLQCQEEYAEIKLGYWFGIISNKHTTSLCPISYCDFSHRTKTKSDYYLLPDFVDGQCSLHRTGRVCSDCKPGYTLAYNSFKCISINQCSPGMTVLVITLTIIYWTVIVVSLFSLTYFFSTQVSSGYFNGVIYFYSVVEILLVRNLFVTDGIFYAVATLSSFAKLTPQVLGRLCIAQELDAIDQQFIHYFHVLGVLFILIGIVMVARYFNKVAFYVKRCVSHVTSLFLVLSYTSVASASLQLLRGIQYNDIDGVYVYISPHLRYFSHRHALYAIVAVLCGFTVVIGLPLLLIVEPFLKKKFNFKKFRPILDQFQDSYQDKYCWFAASYLLYRLVIMLIAYFGNSDNNSMVYFMQTACVIFVINQIFCRPYKKNVLNVLDTAILLTMLLVVNLNNFNFAESTTVGLVYTFLFIPLLLLIVVGFAKPIRTLIMKWQIFNATPMIRRSVLYEPDEDFSDFEEPLMMMEIPKALPRTYNSTCQLETRVHL